MEEKRPFLRHVHYFRAFAIINVVLVHAWMFPESARGGAAHDIVDMVREFLFHDSTIYFMYISGFLFAYLAARLDPLRYYKNKVFNVLLPYLFISVLTLFGESVYKGALFSASAGLDEAFVGGVRAVLSGTAQAPFWYIPFVSLIFIISPLLLKMPLLQNKYFMITVSLLPLFGTRTSTDISPGQYVYFLPVYLQGMYVALNYDRFLAVAERRKGWVAGAALCSSLLVLWLHVHPLSYGMFNLSEAVFYIQKLSLGALVLLLLRKYEHREAPLFDQIAKYSFSIYFVHTLVWLVFSASGLHAVFGESVPLVFVGSLGCALAVLFVSLLLAMGLKRLFGRYSRFFIGA